MVNQHHSSKKPPTQRQLKVGEEIRRTLAEVFQRGDARVPGMDTISITVSMVKISPDLKNASAYVTPLFGERAEEILMLLNTHAPALRHELGKRVSLRYTPKLHFRLDKSFEEAHRINELLKSERVQADLRIAREEVEEVAPY